MPFYKIEVERHEFAHLYVQADSQEEALEAGEELVDWQDHSFDFYSDTWAREIARKEVPEGVDYWTGGPEGSWVTN